MDELRKVLEVLLEERFSGLSKPIRKNLAFLTVAFIQVLSAVRSGSGRLSLGALARALPTEGKAKSRERRLSRFLYNRHLDYRAVASSLAGILVGQRKGFIPVILDQTQSGSAQALFSSVPYAWPSVASGLLYIRLSAFRAGAEKSKPVGAHFSFGHRTVPAPEREAGLDRGSDLFPKSSVGTKRTGEPGIYRSGALGNGHHLSESEDEIGKIESAAGASDSLSGCSLPFASKGCGGCDCLLRP